MNRIDGDTYISGTLTAQSLVPSAGSVRDASVASDAAIGGEKLEHDVFASYSQDSTTDATVERRCIHQVQGATATIISFNVWCVTLASGAGNAVVDLLKNGTTILSSTITLNDTNTVYVGEEPSGFTSTSLVAGDVLEFKLTSAAATKPKGVGCTLHIREAPVAA